MEAKKYVSLNKLGTFLDKLNNKFSPITHKHTTSDITNYAADNQLSPTSINPVQNKVLDAEFEAISTALQVYEDALDGKSDASHTHSNYALSSHAHDDKYYTETEVDTKLSSKANSTHAHSISNITNLQSVLDGKAASSHGTHVSFSSTAPVMDGTASVGSADTVARSDHKHPIDTSRAAQTSLDSHASNTTIHITSTERTNWGTGYSHSQTAHAPSNAEKNQNAFSYVKVGETSIAADTTTDTLTLVAGANVTIMPDATGDSVTISSTDTNTTYSAGTGISLSGTTINNSGVRSISTGSSNGTISVNTNGTSANVAVKGLGSAAYTASTAYDSAGTAQQKADAALASAKAYTDSVKSDLLNGAGTAYDTLKELGDLIDINVDAIEALEAVASGKADSNHTHDNRYYTETEIDSKISTLNTSISGKAASSHTHAIANVTNLQTSLDGKQATITGGATTITSSNLTASRVLISNSSGKVAVSDITSTELSYLDGVSSNIQTQLNGKSGTSHSHSAATTSANGFMSSTDKSKLDGIATGANAYTHPAYTARTGVPTANATPAFGGTFTVSQPISDGSGHITAINSRTITIPSAVATSSANGLMSKSDKSKLDGMVFATVSEVKTYLGI